jgi:hypothetical protein
MPRESREEVFEREVEETVRNCEALEKVNRDVAKHEKKCLTNERRAKVVESLLGGRGTG